MTAAPQRPTRKDAEVDFTARVLAVHLRNHATYTQWLDEVVKVTPPKTDRKTGEMKPGISESKFRGLRKELLERGRVTRLTTGQGSIYSGVEAASGANGNSATNLDETVTVVGDRRAPQSTAETESLIAQVLRHARLRKWPG
jgi:hypothetical protein